MSDFRVRWPSGMATKGDSCVLDLPRRGRNLSAPTPPGTEHATAGASYAVQTPVGNDDLTRIAHDNPCCDATEARFRTMNRARSVRIHAAGDACQHDGSGRNARGRTPS